MERLDFGDATLYSAVEASIHLNRYSIAKPFCKGKRVLDAACGEGYGSFLLKKWGASTVCGLDIDKETVSKANSVFGSTDVFFQCHTVEQLPYPDYYFDLIVSFETIEHLDNPDKFLKEIRRVLRPGGVIIISCPNDPYYYKEDNVSNPFHKRKYTFFEFRECVEEYLGNNVDYFLAFAVDGFLNMPLSCSTEPSGAMPNDMMEMMNYVECSNALCVKQERFINHWNSNYYVGIWGGNEVQKNINAVIFPRETYGELREEYVEILKDIEKKKKNDNEEFLCLKHKLKLETLKNERLSLMLELLNREILCMRENYQETIGKYLLENANLAAKLKETGEALITSQNSQRELDVELTIIKKSKGWKLLKFLYKIEGLFRTH